MIFISRPYEHVFTTLGISSGGLPRIESLFSSMPAISKNHSLAGSRLGPMFVKSHVFE